MKNFKIENIKKEYVFGILFILLTVISLLFFRDYIRGKITGYFTSPTNAPGTTVNIQSDDAYKALVDSYTPSWNESDCYSLFGLDEGRFDFESSNQLYQINAKNRILEKNTSREYTSASVFYLYYFYDKFSVCSFTHLFVLDNSTPVLFEQIKSDIRQEIDYKKIADFSCNNGNISLVMWEQPNGTLTILKSYVIFPEEEVPGGFTAENWFDVNTSISQIRKETLLVNGDKFAYFNYSIVVFLRHYCNPNLPTKITFTE